MLCADSSTGQAPAGPSCPPIDGYPAAYRTFTTRLLQRQVAFGRSVYEQAYGEVKKSHPTLLREVCVNLVQTADAPTAEQVRAAVAKGKDLGDAIAEPVKAGRASESREGCLFLDDAPEALQKAAVDDVVAVSDAAAALRGPGPAAQGRHPHRVHDPAAVERHGPHDRGPAGRRRREGARRRRRAGMGHVDAEVVRRHRARRVGLVHDLDHHATRTIDHHAGLTPTGARPIGRRRAAFRGR